LSEAFIPLLKPVVSKALNVVERFYGSQRLLSEIPKSRLDAHLKMLSSWCSEIQHYGMPAPKSTKEDTVPIDLAIGARRFRPQGAKVKTFGEDALLSDGQDYVLLGDPGAGKTTTLKRLVFRLLFEEPTAEGDIYQFPLLISPTNLSTVGALPIVLANQVGLPIAEKYRSKEDGLLYEQPPTKIVKVKNRLPHEPKTKKVAVDHDAVLLINDSPALDAIAEFMDASKCVLFVDGLDEFAADVRQRLEDDLKDLASLIRSSKIIASCRTGDYSRQIGGYTIVELERLSKTDIETIAQRWVERSQDFLKALYSKPYQELANRPLFLIQLIMLYNMSGRLPERGVDIYRKIVLLCLEKWDQDRKIERPSRYANFVSERKHDFLSELAWILLFEQGAKSFTTEQLEVAYKQICSNYGLPIAEAVAVAHEIESHTGIILNASFEQFEFSHLTLQEFLAAEHIVRDGYIRNFRKHFSASSAPFAVATSHSSNPTRWFNKLVLENFLQEQYPQRWSDRIHTFLSRLSLEETNFSEGDLFGVAIWTANSACIESNGGVRLDVFSQFIDKYAGRISMQRAAKYYGQTQTEKHDVIEFKMLKKSKFELAVPERLLVSARIADLVLT
jgi:predicted NACHT family NTPase